MFYLGAIFLVIITFISYRLSLKYTVRSEFYKDFIKYNSILISQVNFGNKSNKTILQQLGNNSLFNGIIKSKFTNKPFDIKKLKKEDVELINQYYDAIGKNTRDNELKLLNDYSQKLNDILKQCLDEEKKYKTLYVKLGFLFGLIVFVLML